MRFAAILLLAMPTTALADARGVRVADGFAECIVGFMPKQSLALLDTVPDSTEERAFLTKFGKVSGCMGLLRGKLRMSGPFMRRAIAIALYRRDYGKSRWTNIGTTDAPRAAGVADLLAHDLARCLVSRVPTLAHDFVVARPGTDAAERAFRPIGAEFANCAPANGGLRTTPTLLRARLVEAMYDFRALAKQMADAR